MPSSNPLPAPPLGGHVEIAGRRVAFERRGSGAPTVVFLPGAGLVGLDYLDLHAAIAAEATSVIYDRLGTGWSDEAALPRTAAEVAGELKALLEAIGTPGPVVLVGHSLGGAYARRFAQLHPDQVAGLVLLDPADEGYLEMAPRSLAGQLSDLLRMGRLALGVRRFYRRLFETMFAAWPADVREVLIAHHLVNLTRTLAERRNLWSGVLPEIAGGGPLPDRPTILLVAMGLDPFQAAFSSPDWLRQANAAKPALYARRLEGLRQGELRLVEAGHSTLHTQAPAAVLDAIREVLRRATLRDPAPPAAAPVPA